MESIKTYNGTELIHGMCKICFSESDDILPSENKCVDCFEDGEDTKTTAPDSLPTINNPNKKIMPEIKKYTLKEISELAYMKHTLTWERFDYYFKTLYNHNDREIKWFFELYTKFPGNVYNIDDTKDNSTLEYVLEKAKYIVDMINSAAHLPFYDANGNEVRDLKRKIYFSENEVIRQLEVNFNNATEIIAYAEVLKRGVVVLCVLNHLETVWRPGNNKEQFDIWEGDIFNTYDTYWNPDKSRVFIATGDGLRHLLYVKGKGYLKKGKPHYDTEHKYTSYAITGNEQWRKIGNVITDLHLLQDGDIK